MSIDNPDASTLATRAILDTHGRETEWRIGPWRLSADEIAWVKERYTSLIPSGMALDAVEQAIQETANRFPRNHTPKRLLMYAVLGGATVFDNVRPTDTGT